MGVGGGHGGDFGQNVWRHRHHLWPGRIHMQGQALTGGGKPAILMKHFLIAVKDGPSLARVDRLEVNWDNMEEETYDSFLAY